MVVRCGVALRFVISVSPSWQIIWTSSQCYCLSNWGPALRVIIMDDVANPPGTARGCSSARCWRRLCIREWCSLSISPWKALMMFHISQQSTEVSTILLSLFWWPCGRSRQYSAFSILHINGMVCVSLSPSRVAETRRYEVIVLTGWE